MEEDTGALPQKEDFSRWYNEILWRAEIMDVRYPVKGLVRLVSPHGFAIRKRAYGILRDLMDREHAETIFPLLIPKTEFMKEATHIKGFEDEVYWVTHGGKNELECRSRSDPRARPPSTRCTRSGSGRTRTCPP